MPEFKIKHTTKYSYQGQVRDSANQIILYPVNDEYQEILKHELKISGDPLVDVYRDYYGNEVGNFTISTPHSELSIISKVIVTTRPKPLPQDDIFASLQWQELKDVQNKIPYIDYLKHEHFVGLDEVKEVVGRESKAGFTPYQVSVALCRYVYENFSYLPGITTVETTLDTIWELKAGVCQDFAHILLAMLRFINIPARYVSGYICPSKNGMRGQGATHAWVEAFLPGYGWLGLDPTNNCVANETHVRLAVGRNFSDCSPVKGVYKGLPDHKLEVSVIVSYEKDDPKTEEKPEVVIEKPRMGFPGNSFQRYVEMQQQQ